MDQQSEVPQASDAKARREKRTKMGFVVVLIIAASIVYMLQRGDPPVLRGWRDDFDQVLKDAKRDNRRVLVFFVGTSLSQTARNMLSTTLRKPGNAAAIEKGNFIKAHVRLDHPPSSDLAERYRITTLPTMVILDANGKERNRRTGFIGEAPFRTSFLSCKDVQEP